MPTDVLDAPPVPDRVQAGVDLLDREVPGWVGYVDLDSLDVTDECRCVLGQVFGGGARDGYSEGLDELDIVGRASVYGFCAADNAGGYDDERRLTAAWRNRIEARQVAA
jgi:hypothetical protein